MVGAHWPAFPHVNKLLITHQLSKTLCTGAGNAVDRCREERRDWSFAVGVSAFRKELSAEARVGEGDCRVRAETSSVIPRGIAVRRQGAGMPYMFISTQIRLVRIPHLQTTRVVLLEETRSSSGIYLLGRAAGRILLINQARHLQIIVYAVACNILHAGKRQTVEATSGARSVRVCFVFFPPRCPKLKTHVPQLLPLVAHVHLVVCTTGAT